MLHAISYEVIATTYCLISSALPYAHDNFSALSFILSESNDPTVTWRTSALHNAMKIMHTHLSLWLRRFWDANSSGMSENCRVIAMRKKVSVSLCAARYGVAYRFRTAACNGTQVSVTGNGNFGRRMLGRESVLYHRDNVRTNIEDIIQDLFYCVMMLTCIHW